jgi:lipopolysaccharide heptosyltransferase II
VRILLVRLREIGDVVFTTPVVTALRRRFPEAHLTYLVEPAAAPVVVGSRDLDEVIVVPRQHGWRGLGGDVALIRRLRAAQYDLAIDFHGGPRASFLTWLSGARTRVGYEVIGRAWMYTVRVARPRALRPRHSVENQWDLVASLGCDPPDRVTCPVSMPVDPMAERRVVDRLSAAAVRPTDRLVIMHVSAGNPFRRWPISSFAAVAAHLAASNASCRVLVTSGPSEATAASAVIAEARAALIEEAADRVLDAGEFSLAELRALADRAAVYIGGDSGPMHVAATSRIPIVSLYGPTLPARSEPWRDPAWPVEAIEVNGLPCRPCDQRRCEPGDYRCLMRISAEQVIAAVERVLDRARVTEASGR